MLSLTNQTRYLPGWIAELMRKASVLATEILELAEGGQIDLKALVADLYQPTGPTPPCTAGASDRKLRSLIKSGFLTI